MNRRDDAGQAMCTFVMDDGLLHSKRPEAMLLQTVPWYKRVVSRPKPLVRCGHL